MGNTHSAGRDNDELVDLLVKANYITSPDTEQAFRHVDRGDYITEQQVPRSTIYADQSLRSGDLHLSAPCIYAKVVDALMLKKGDTFLNVGSGTGYLSTIVGTRLGAGVVNHGIEIKEGAVMHAYKCLDKFITTSCAFDATQFAIPMFVYGSGLDLDPEYRKYDKIYIGADVPSEYKDFFCSMLKVKGILVMPYQDQLVSIERKDEFEFDCNEILSVTFTPLITDTDVYPGQKKKLIHIESKVKALQDLCRLHIYKRVGRENLASLTTLPICTTLQDYLCYHRDPTLPTSIIRKQYSTEPPEVRPLPIINLLDPIVDFPNADIRRYLEQIRQDHAAEEADEDSSMDEGDEDDPGGHLRWEESMEQNVPDLNPASPPEGEGSDSDEGEDLEPLLDEGD